MAQVACLVGFSINSTMSFMIEGAAACTPANQNRSSKNWRETDFKSKVKIEAAEAEIPGFLHPCVGQAPKKTPILNFQLKGSLFKPSLTSSALVILGKACPEPQKTLLNYLPWPFSISHEE